MTDHRLEPSAGKPSPGTGRARDPGIDARVLQAAARQLAAFGYDGMTVAAVADEAGTTRQAVYRRWPDKAELAAAALAAFTDRSSGPETADPFDDLVAELTDFQRGVSGPGRLSLVGTMLQDSTESGVRARYQAQVIAPRRQRLRLVFERARQLGIIDADADLEVAITLCTGSWYARALAGAPPPENWPRRTAALVWRAVGGTAPSGGRPPGGGARRADPGAADASTAPRSRAGRLGAGPLVQGDLPLSTQRLKTSVRSAGQAPSQGIVPATSRSRIAAAC